MHAGPRVFPLPYDGEFSFTSWGHALPRLILKSGTSFASFIAKTLRLERDDDLSISTALFPLPLPDAFPVGGSARACRGRRASSLALAKVLHVAVMALNFLHAGEKHIPLHCLRRPPSFVHQQVFARLRVLIRACARLSGNVPFCAGRRGTHLVARFAELASFLNSSGLGLSGYPNASPNPPPFVPHDVGGPESLRPFRPLDAKRIVIHGTGAWDLAPFLEPELAMAYREPSVLAFSGTNGPHPTFYKEDPEQALRLFKVWDAKSLLLLRPGPLPDDRLTRVFGAWKSPGQDRQIGDRRGPNSYEAKIGGPSKELPTGPLITKVSVQRYTHCLRGSAVDRRDFYHQACVTRSKAFANAVGPAFALRDFEGLAAHADFLAWAEGQNRSAGNHPSCRPRPILVDPDTPVHGCFASLFQGDAAGVEYATAAHAGFLEAAGVLPTSERGRLVSGSPVAPDGPWLGLVIDDLFAIASTPVAVPAGPEPPPDEGEKLLRQAKLEYGKAGIAGSDAKDIFGQTVFTVAGAQVDSSPASVADGLTSVGCPATKRLALALVSLKVAAGRAITEELCGMLTGSWISCLLYRRCLMSVLDSIFGISLRLPASSGSSLVPLKPRQRQELVLLSALAPLMVSNVAVPFCEQAYASDASLAKGGYTSADVGPDVSRALWLSSDAKGFYTMLDRPEGAALAALGLERDSEAFVPQDSPQSDPKRGLTVPKPLAQYFDFLEICGGAGGVSHQLAALGHVIGPIVDLSCSPEFDIEQTHVLEWILFLLQSGRLKAVMIEPPCTTFSGPARPCLRTYAVPEGFDRTFPRTWRGNRQAFFAIVIFVVAWRAGAPALVEQPRTSKMRRTKAWQYALSLTGVEENFLASCAYGSPFRKEFALLGTGLNLSRIHRRCPRDHHHVRVEGSFAKSSTAYHPEVAKAFASVFHEAINSKPGHARSRTGLEGLLANDVLSAFAWKTKAAWAWKRPEHINVLETRAFTRVPRDLTLAGGDLRYAHIVDSAVALGAVSKGRSSARTLKPALKASAAIQVAGGIYPGLHFGPTRLNTADAPTRDLELPDPVPHSLARGLTPLELRTLSLFLKLSKPIANWIRLAALVSGSKGSVVSFLKALSTCQRQVGPAVAESIPSGCSTNHVLDFDGTLGFPGEGPTARQTGLDVGRQERRASRPLPLGRPVLDRTRQNRDALILAFSSWLRERGIQLQDFLFGAGFDIEQLNNALVSYGRELYDLGKPYWHYSETVNAISALKPSVRRQLQAAWDTAFSWLAMEPYTHHVPMPPVILLAMLTVCLMWGWVAEAGLFAMSWGGLLRIGEATSARRKQLILPVDVLHVQSFILLQILEPKTRLRGARHQAAKIERSDLIDVIQLAFEFYDPEQRLWPFTNQTLRRRFDAILERLDIRRSSSGARPLDLGSFRPGGATHMLQCCEDSERVRRRGRWASPKVMEIYLQEVASSTFFPSLDLRTRELVYGFAQAFSSTLDQALTWRRLGLPPSSWYALFLHSSK